MADTNGKLVRLKSQLRRSSSVKEIDEMVRQMTSSVEKLEEKLEAAERRADAAELARAAIQFDIDAERADLYFLQSLRETLLAESLDPLTMGALRGPLSRGRMGPTRIAILDVMRLEGPDDVWAPRIVFEALSERGHEVDLATVQTTMHRMAKAGQLLSPARGAYLLTGSDRRG